MLEAWVLLWLGILQLAIAAWWWQGPHLEGTRAWGAGLFLLNGVATLAAIPTEMAAADPARWLQTLADRGTNLMLFGLAVAALPNRPVLRRARRGLLLGVTAVFLLAYPSWWWGQVTGSVPVLAPDLASRLTEAPMLLAIALLPLGFHHALQEPDGRKATAWTAVLGVLGFRYGELVGIYFVDRIPLITSTDPIHVLNAALSLAALLGVTATVLLLARRVFSSDPNVHVLTEVALVLVVGGSAWGLTRKLWPGEPYSLIIFSLALLRPVGFLGAQGLLSHEPGLPHAHTGDLLRGGAGFLVSLGAVAVSDLIWSRPPLQTLVLGTVLALAAVTLMRRVELPQPRPAPGTPTIAAPKPPEPTVQPDPPPETGLPPALPEALERDRVTLPDDWRKRLETAWRTYRELPPGTQEALAALPQWKRLLLALRVAEDRGPLPAYERTTPGLHLQTQCAYASIGPEINRANDRWRDILNEEGVAPPPHTGERAEALVESSWGRAEGLESPRVKFYQLTELGVQVAHGILDEVGLGLQALREAPSIVGEALPKADAGAR